MGLQGISNFYISEEWREIDSIGSLPIPEEDVFDTSSSVNTIKPFFTNDTWMAIEQKCKELGEILISYLQ